MRSHDFSRRSGIADADPLRTLLRSMSLAERSALLWLPRIGGIRQKMRHEFRDAPRLSTLQRLQSKGLSDWSEHDSWVLTEMGSRVRELLDIQV